MGPSLPLSSSAVSPQKIQTGRNPTQTLYNPNCPRFPQIVEIFFSNCPSLISPASIFIFQSLVTTQTLNMKPHILPVSNPNASSSIHLSSSSSPEIKSAAAMLIGPEDDLGATVMRILMPPPSEEDKKNEARPLIPRTSSYTEMPNSYQQKRRRRVASDNSLLTLSAAGHRSFRQDVGRAASDTYLVTRLGFKLLRYLG